MSNLKHYFENFFNQRFCSEFLETGVFGILGVLFCSGPIFADELNPDLPLSSFGTSQIELGGYNKKVEISLLPATESSSSEIAFTLFGKATPQFSFEIRAIPAENILDRGHSFLISSTNPPSRILPAGSYFGIEFKFRLPPWKPKTLKSEHK